MKSTASDDTLISDSQLNGFSAFKQRLGYCCCRLLGKTSTYHLSSVSTADKDLQANSAGTSAKSREQGKQERQAKLDRIAETLPGDLSTRSAGSTATRDNARQTTVPMPGATKKLSTVNTRQAAVRNAPPVNNKPVDETTTGSMHVPSSLRQTSRRSLSDESSDEGSSSLDEDTSSGSESD
jgi:hypothetical protein